MQERGVVRIRYLVLLVINDSFYMDGDFLDDTVCSWRFSIRVVKTGARSQRAVTVTIPARK